jgi:hypothetical protein
MLRYIACLKKIDARINPFYYDLPYLQVRRVFPHEKLPCGPPSENGVVEESPFIPFIPWITVTPVQRSHGPLILKSPSNSYRLSFFRTLFPNARICILHIVRDPVDSIAGLMAGWKHHGFFKHLLTPDSLNIEGYSTSSLPWTCQWWKFDLPPGWSKYAAKPLVETCTYQWCSANNHVLQWVHDHASEITYVQLKYENMIRDLRREVLALCKAIKVTPDIGLLSSLQVTHRVMTTTGISREFRKHLRVIAEEMRSDSAVTETQRAITHAEYSLARFRETVSPITL